MRVLRWVGIVLLGLLLVAGVGACGGYLFVKGGTLPELDGELRLRGLESNVEVEREPSGVAHIRAGSERDAFFTLGVVHAQDRLWQMEFQRRAGAGRLSEVLGADAVAQDEFLRTLGLYRAAEGAYRGLSPEGRRVVDAYVSGINAYLRSEPNLPVEFRLLGYEPEKWRPADVLVWGKMMSLDLSANYESELRRYRLGARGIGPERILELLPPYPDDAPTVLAAGEAGAPPSRERGEKVAGALLEVWRSLPHSLEASNSWVVSGRRTRSGRPLLANDPHLGLQVPSLWYLAHIECPTLNVVGATLPGLPGVITGRNKRIAWGVTNVRADVQDLYLIDEIAGGGAYNHGGETREYKRREETIEVRGAEDVTIEVRETVYGPVVSDVVDDPGDTPLALRWTSLDSEDRTIEAFLGVNRAGNWKEFNEALRSYNGPSQSFVYADTRGNIGYAAPGKFPIRAEGHTGLAPVAGDGERDWRGWIPFGEWPRALNPEAGFIVTANNKIVPDSYPYTISLEWAEPYRAQRIREMILRGGESLTVEDMVSMQQDRRSLLFEELRPILEDMGPALRKVEALVDDPARLPEVRGWRTRLLAWDGEVGPRSREATLFEAWYSELTRLPRREVGADHWAEPRYLLEALRGRDANCDIWNTLHDESCMEFAALSFVEVISRFDYRVPEWGEIHRATFEHPVLTGTPLARLSDRQVPFGGDDFTVNVGGYDPGTFDMRVGPSYRHIIDLARPENSLFVHPMGQSGNLLSPRFDNLLEMWQRGRYLPMLTEDYDTENRLTLEPER